MNTQKESEVFSHWSMVMARMGLGRLIGGSAMSPFLLGDEPMLPDFHLFHILKLGKTFSEFFSLPALDLAEGDEKLTAFYQSMAERPASIAVFDEQDKEKELTRREIFEEFGKAYSDILAPAKAGLSALFGHEV